jgi:hypothetical protein
MWKGHAVANLMIVKGDTATVHLDSYTLKQNNSGNPMAGTVEIRLRDDRLAQVPD